MRTCLFDLVRMAMRRITLEEQLRGSDQELQKSQRELHLASGAV